MQVHLVPLRSFCDDFIKVAFTAGTNTISFTDGAGGIEAIAAASVADVSKAMVVKVKSDCHTDTPPNAKHEILQQGYIGTKSHFQVSEPTDHRSVHLEHEPGDGRRQRSH